jgi:hypothetical protein
MTTALEMVGAFPLAATLLTAAMSLAARHLGRLITRDDGQRAVEENASDEPSLEPHRSEHRRRSAARSAHCRSFGDASRARGECFWPPVMAAVSSRSRHRPPHGRLWPQEQPWREQSPPRRRHEEGRASCFSFRLVSGALGLGTCPTQSFVTERPDRMTSAAPMAGGRRGLSADLIGMKNTVIR